MPESIIKVARQGSWLVFATNDDVTGGYEGWQKT